ncbi:MAG: hypothetical protein PUD44_11750 [Clostridiaceae bacterium]|nr:hypothetical protein [Clostridiales bacterium]MDD6878431.1 hypothetical protein [Clostridiaceae bacterium]MDY3072600.1 hypothetical protein [Eubacteriales bacterium]MDY3286579.1 hypothetical protein [Eubacteriales bacterium]MDY5015543.1 hypothetical protein [Eubacteriales bacterium]
MAGGIDELIDVLYGMIEEAWSMPLGKDKCVIEREKALDILDELRGNMPGEIKAAREIVEKRNDLIASGKKEADSLRRTAEEKARSLVDQNEIAAQAKQRAKEISASAETQAAELKRAAGAYCDDLLKRTEESIAASLAEVRKIRAEFKAAAGVK